MNMEKNEDEEEDALILTERITFYQDRERRGGGSIAARSSLMMTGTCICLANKFNFAHEEKMREIEKADDSSRNK